MEFKNSISALLALFSIILANPSQAQTSNFLSGFVTGFECDDLATETIGSACIVVIETADVVRFNPLRIEFGHNLGIQRIVLIADYAEPVENFDRDLPYQLLGEQIEIKADRLMPVKSEHLRKGARGRSGT